MRLTLVASLVLCGSFCTGCESLHKTATWPGKKPAMPEQLANDLKRREATEKQIAKTSPLSAPDKSIQQTNFTPAAAPPSEIDPILLQAKQAEQAQQNQIAKTLYSQVLQSQPQNAEAHHRLGVLADQEGRYPEAQQHYQAALQQAPQNASLLSDIGYSYYSQDRLDDAEKHLNQALLIQPGNQYARNNLAHVYGRRAQQTGSAEDYKLAEEQFQMALGPQGAEAQMKQLFPQGATAPGGPTQDKRGLLNPFKKTDKGGSRFSLLTAPKPKTQDGTALLLEQMEREKQKLIEAGEWPQKRPKGGPAMGNLPANENPNLQRPVPLHQMNDALLGIDHEAEAQQRQAQRDAYPANSRGPVTAPQGWNPGDGIQPAGGWNDPQEYGAGNAPSGGNRPGPRSGGGPPMGRPNANHYPAPNGGGYDQGYPPNGPQPGFNGPNGSETYNQYQNGGDLGYDNPAPNQRGNVRPASVEAAPSWPDAAGSSNQFDARGNNWDGQSIINEPQPGRDSTYSGTNDPSYRMGNGQAFGPQRPNGGNRNNPTGGDAGRQAAAQLGLDAGLGEMFPGGDSNGGMNPQGSSSTNPRNVSPAGYNWNTDPSMAPIPTTPRGMPPGGNGMMAPADYSYQGPSYQNNGYSQGVNPTMGDNYGQQTDDVSAPWNQNATLPRNSRQVQQLQYSNEGAAQGRFAPSRQGANPQSQNFGAPPMYYGR